MQSIKYYIKNQLNVFIYIKKKMEKNEQLIQIITVINWINTSQTKDQFLFHIRKSIFKNTMKFLI